MHNQNQFIHHSSAVLMACGLIASLLPGLAAAQDLSTRQARKIIPLSGEWEFATGSMNRMPDSFDKTVSVPGFHPKGEALWYRRTVTIDGPLPEVVRLEVKKASYGAKVWVNGSEAGESWSIHTAAFIDIGKFLKGNGEENEIVIRVCGNTDLIPPEIPWYQHLTHISDLPTDFVKRETGIYDSVSLITCDVPYVLRAQAAPNVEDNSVKLAVTLRNTDSTARQVLLKVSIINDKTGDTVANGEKRLQAAAGESDSQIDIGIPGAKLWTPESPHLYRFEVEVRSGGKHTDTFASRFGMRTFSVCQETGRGLLNGRPVLLRGVGMFSMWDVASYYEHLMYDELAIRHAFRFVKSLNGNAVRFSFDLMPEIWYRIADEEGILVQDEAHWQINTSATLENVKAEFSDWIHERANHPCVVIWDAANESPHERHGGPLFRKAIQAVRHLDLSNRPWEPSTWFLHTKEAPFYTQKGDVTEWHPYSIWSYKANHANAWFKDGMIYPEIFENGPPARPAGPGWIANEYCGFFLRRDGSFFLVGDGPPSFAADHFAEVNGSHYLLGRSRFVAWETEYYRRLPGCLGVLWSSHLWGSGIQQPLASPTLSERELALGRFVASAAAPVGVMVDNWKTKLPTGRRKVSVSVANDGLGPWSGTVSLSLIRAGENLFKMGALFQPPETQAEIDQRTVHQWKQDLNDVPVSQQGEAVFDVVIPEAGNYHFMAEITGLDGKPVRSWRDFVSTGDPVGAPSPAPLRMLPAVAAGTIELNRIGKLKTKSGREPAKQAVEEYYAQKAPSGSYKGCDAYIDFRDLLARQDIDAVIIGTPDHWHAIMAIEAARNGKDIYCEKPLSLTIGEARAMVNAVRRYNRVFQTGSQQRSESGFRFACELVRNGYIGEVKSVIANIGGPSGPCDLPGQPTPDFLEWDLWLGPAPWRTYNDKLHPARWRSFWDYSGGGMTDWGAHHFDIAQWGLGMDHTGPVEVLPPDGKDIKVLTFRYANGATLTRDQANGPSIPRHRPAGSIRPGVDRLGHVEA